MVESRERIRPGVKRFRAMRKLARVLSPLIVWNRKRAMEGMLRALFGETVEARGHLMEVDPRDRVVGARLRRHGIWERAETELYERVVRPGDRVIDAGAQIGYFTLLFARLVGPRGRVTAVEPEPGNLRLLERNVVRNGYGNVRTVGKALSRTSGDGILHLDDSNLGDHRLRDGGGDPVVVVEVTTLDACVAENGPRVDFLKMDIQGAEPAALEGAERILAASPDLIMLTEFWPDGIREAGDSPSLYLERLAAHGFSVAILDDAGSLKPVSNAGERRDLCRPAVSVNLVCWRERSPL